MEVGPESRNFGEGSSEFNSKAIEGVKSETSVSVCHLPDTVPITYKCSFI